MEDSSRTDNVDASPLRDGSIPDSAPVINVGSSGVKSNVLKGDGSRTFTMRELLKDLKEEDHNGSDGNKNADDSRSFSQDISHQQHIGHHDTSLDLINSISGVDEESLSRQRILAFSAKRYASAVERNPDDHDAYYNLALLLQETANSINPDSGLPSKDALLEEACKKYNEATRLCPTFYDAYYNWAIAIAERATLRGRTKAAEEFWKQAAENNEKAVRLNWNSPQALNNWGLALQELSVIVPVKEKPAIVRSAISKFRASMRLQFDFHRAVYNLGTVLYNLAEDKLGPDRQINAKEISPSELYSLSAFYTAAAHAFKPSHPAYHGALRLLRTKLPLPYLKVGYLKAPPATKPIAPHVDWARSQFALNHESLQQVTKGDKQLSQSPSGRFQGSPHADKLIKIDIPDIVSVSECADLTLPPGAALCIDTIHGPVYLVADIWESANGWVDAIRLVYTIVTRGKSDILAGIITG